MHYVVYRKEVEVTLSGSSEDRGTSSQNAVKTWVEGGMLQQFSEWCLNRPLSPLG